jgi:predicted nucleic acid-binding protein
VILVDTSAWIRHLRAADRRLSDLLREQRVFTCDVVTGELTLGSGLPAALHQQLGLLPRVPVPTSKETLEFLQRHHRPLRTVGVGWADVQIIAAAAQSGALLYSHDRPQRTAWRRLGFRLGG